MAEIWYAILALMLTAFVVWPAGTSARARSSTSWAARMSGAS
jgi:hypothetical protein